MRFKRFIALLLILALFSVLVPTSFAEDGETFYVDSLNGDDSQDGHSPGTAFKTLYMAFNREFHPGAQILFCRGGTYQAGKNTANACISSSGTEQSPILLGAYGTGANPVLTTDADEPVLCVTGSFIHISGLDFTAPNGSGIEIVCPDGRDLYGFDISDCRFYNIYDRKLTQASLDRYAIFLQNYFNTRAHDFSFRNLEIHNCAVGINIAGTCFEACPEYYISPEESYHEHFLFDGIYCHDVWCGGLILGALYDSVVRNSRFIRCAGDVSFAVAAMWTHGCDHVTMEYCEIAESTNLIDGMAIDFDGWSTNCTYRYIYSHDNNRFMRNCLYDAVTRNRGNTVDHCLSVNDNRFPNEAALPLANTGTMKVNKGRIALVMDGFTFTNNYLINCSPTYFGNLSNATITGNYFGGRTFLTAGVSSFWSFASSTCSGTVRDNTFYRYTPLLRIGNKVTCKAVTAEEAYRILFPDGVHTSAR